MTTSHTHMTYRTFTGGGPFCALLDAPDAWEALEEWANRIGDNALGLLLAKSTDEPLFPAFRTAGTRQTALAKMANDTCERRPWEQIDLKREGDIWSVRRRFMNGDGVGRRQEAELGLAGLMLHLRAIFGTDWVPIEVHFQHARPADYAPHAAFFHAPVLFGQDFDALFISDRTLRAPLTAPPSPSRGKRGFTLWSQPSLTARVRAEVRTQISGGEPRLETVADALGLSPKTLQRRLAVDGAHFSSIVIDIRRSLSLYLLSESHLPVSEISDMLGYSEVSAFSRVCRRWFGASPTRVRTDEFRKLQPREGT